MADWPFAPGQEPATRPGPATYIILAAGVLLYLFLHYRSAIEGLLGL